MRPLLQTAMLLLTVATSASGRAEGAGTTGVDAIDVPRLSLEQALMFARDHHPLLREAEARVAAADAEADVPRKQWMPRLGATAQLWVGSTNNSTAQVLGASAVDLPRIGATRITDKTSYDASASTLAAVGLRQQVFDFGRTHHQVSAEAELAMAERRESDAVWLDIELTVKHAFFAVQAARALVDAAQAARDRAVAHRDMVSAAIKNGVRAPVDLAREEAELQRFEVELDNARSSLVLARSGLAEAVGSDLVGIDIVPEPDEVVASAWPAQPDDVVDREPELLAVRARLRSQQSRSDALGAERLPALWLSGAFSGRQGGAAPSAGPSDRYNGFLPSLANWDVGLVLSWNIFDQVASARVNASRANERVLAAHLAVASQAQRAKLRQAFNEVEMARRTMPALERALETARENHSQAEARFRAGLGTTVDLGDAEQLLTAAEDGMVIGRLRWAQAKAVYDRLLAVRTLP